jgi:hypothetical protein
MHLIGLLAFALITLLQEAAPQPSADDLLDAREKAKLASAANAADRIKVYQAAARRYQTTLEADISREDFSQTPDNLKRWTAMLSAALEDIEANLKVKKRSKPLIRFEIELRKNIAAFHSFKTKVPADQQDLFATSLDQAEKIRKKFIDMIFQH